MSFCLFLFYVARVHFAGFCLAFVVGGRSSSPIRESIFTHVVCKSSARKLCPTVAFAQHLVKVGIFVLPVRYDVCKRLSQKCLRSQADEDGTRCLGQILLHVLAERFVPVPYTHTSAQEQ